MLKLEIPEFALVILIGPPGSGKSALAQQFFKPAEIISEASCRKLLEADEEPDDPYDPVDPGLLNDTYELMRAMAAARLKRRLLTVLDGRHAHPRWRQPLMRLAREYFVSPIGIALDLPFEWCAAQTSSLRPHELAEAYSSYRHYAKQLPKEGFQPLYLLKTPQQLQELEIIRTPLENNYRHQSGPFDLIGDVHGCCDELEALLLKLGYQQEAPLLYRPPAGRKAIFVGDLIDRGPRNLDTLNLAMKMQAQGYAYCAPGNHEARFKRYLEGKKVKLSHGLAETVTELEKLSPASQESFKAKAIEFIQSLPGHLVLDQGRLVVAHAGLKESMQGREAGRVRSFALYGDTTGEIDDFGLPVRLDWAAHYRGRAQVVYGHVPVLEAQWHNQTLDIDTGCVFGGKLTALRYPESELVSVPAARVYYPPKHSLRS